MQYFLKWKTIFTLSIILSSLLCVFPNSLENSSLQAVVLLSPKAQSVTALDNQGGVHLLLEMDRDVIVKKWRESLRTNVFETLWHKNKIKHTIAMHKHEIIVVPTKMQELPNALHLLREELAADPNKSSAGWVAKTLSWVREKVGGVQKKKVTYTVTETKQKHIRIGLSPAVIQSQIRYSIDLAIETLQRRLQAARAKNPTIQRQGENHILVQVPGLKNSDSLKKYVTHRGSLTFQLADPKFRADQSRSGFISLLSERVWSHDSPPIAHILKKKVIVGSDDLIDAQPGFDRRTSEAVIRFRLNAHGTKAFGEASSQNIGQDFAIVVDGKVVSRATMREPILSGSGQISGNFTLDEAMRISILLRSGLLFAPLKIVEDRIIKARPGKKGQ